MIPALHLNRIQPATTAQPKPRALGTHDLELALCVACLMLLALGALGPTVIQSSHYHAFADQRSLLGVPNMMDVLSNLAFAGFGVVGARRIRLLPQRVLSPAQTNLARLFFAGLALTAAFSGWYHLQPDNDGLAIDRHGMTIAFAGLLGLAATTRVSDRAGQWLALAVLLCGAWSIQTWSTTTNVMPWAVLQFGGMALMAGLALLAPRNGALPVSWGAVILLYALAKILEHNDVEVYHLTGEMVSGHTLKHIVASCAALPVLSALARAGRTLESPAHGAAFRGKR